MSLAEPVLVYCPCASREEARAIARTCVEERLAACGNVLGEIESIYRWAGAIASDTEVALLLKTDAAHRDRLIARMGELHSHDVPAIIALPAATAPASFRRWLADELQA